MSIRVLASCQWTLLAVGVAPGWPAAGADVLTHSDVVFMYQADRQIYETYGATVLAWGGKPTPASAAQNSHVKVFGSVGMVTEFARYYERSPQNYEEGLARDVHGKPVKVPWLTDHQHKGIPFWWCCTQQPLFREYLMERVVETVKAGADGLHIDDHMGTSGGLWLGLCFCDRCVAGFRQHLQSIPTNERANLGIAELETFNYRDAVLRWMGDDLTAKRQPTQHPLWQQWTAYQCRAAAAFMAELHALANKTAGRSLPMGANAGLLWPRHLADYQTLNLFSAETDHHAERQRFSDLPIFAYRLADAVQRPYASTASGGDWAYVAEHNTPGLVRGWIALSYAAGHRFMAPHRQWCYTPAKGTHWYQGPAEKFAPLYQFVRQNAALFDGYDTFADIGIVLPHRAFTKNANRWFELGQQFATKNVSYRLLLAGDEIVDHPLSARELESNPVLLVPERDDLLPADLRTLNEHTRDRRVYARTDEALAAIRPAVQIEGGQPVRTLVRVKAGAVVVHLLNYAYDSARDDVKELAPVRVYVNRVALGLPDAAVCWFISPGTERRRIAWVDDTLEIPALGLWGLLELRAEDR